MTMFLINGMSAEVEPVPGKPGWFQLTGKHIERWTMPMEEALPEMDVEQEHLDAKVMGIHDWDEEIAYRDPRFAENCLEEPMFAVMPRPDGTFRMYLSVNQPEYVLFRFLAPHEAKELGDEFDPLSSYRIEKPAAKKAPAKKAAAKKSKATA